MLHNCLSKSLTTANTITARVLQMGDPLGLVLSALGTFGRARAAVKNVQNFPSTLRDRLVNGESVLQRLQRDPRKVAHIGIEHELDQFQGLADRIKNLVQEYTAAPGASRCERVRKAFMRSFHHKNLEKELQEIGEKMRRVLGAISAKRATGQIFPRPLPPKAAVPAGALALPRSFVERVGVQEAEGDLIDPEKALTPYTVVVMGGGGKLVLASAVVRQSSVLEHFRGGVFWMRVGRGAKSSLLSLLQVLAREMGAAPTHGYSARGASRLGQPGAGGAAPG